eukprot:15479097-Alexandrium_andersonii.AAC.1
MSHPERYASDICGGMWVGEPPDDPGGHPGVTENAATCGHRGVDAVSLGVLDSPFGTLCCLI